MTAFQVHSIDQAPQASQALLAKAKAAYGFVPNLLGVMAESPALLEAYMTLADIFGTTELSETERQIILMTSNRLNGCTYCMAAHTTISQGAKVPADVIDSLREGTAIADDKLEALRRFTVKVVESRGWPEQADLDAFLGAGYTQRTIFEVILGTSLKVLSNYTNHVAETPLDAPFSANAWQETVSTEA